MSYYIPDLDTVEVRLNDKSYNIMPPLVKVEVDSILWFRRGASGSPGQLTNRRMSGGKKVKITNLHPISISIIHKGEADG